MPQIFAAAVDGDVAVGQTCFQRIEIVPTQLATKIKRKEGNKAIGAFLCC
jgi:hypothetical protein